MKKIAFACLLRVNKPQINYPISRNPWEVIISGPIDICWFSKPPTRPLPQHDSIALLQVSQSKSVGKCAAANHHHQCLRIHRHGAARRRTIRTGGGPIMMTGISPSAPRFTTDGAPAGRGFRGMNSNICLSGNHAALPTPLRSETRALSLILQFIITSVSQR